jgi:hypothetical protein
MRINDLSSSEIGQASYFAIPSHGISLNIITNALEPAVESVRKQKKHIQCCQLKFPECS